MNKVSVALLNYNGEKILPQFLPSVVRHSPEAEIVLIDNASTDRSVAFVEKNFPSVKIIRLDKNYGFAEGYNRGLSCLGSEFFVLLNTDVEVTENWLAPMIDFLKENSDTDACQPKILSHRDKTRFEHAGAAGGFIDKWGYPLCRGRVMNVTETDHGQHDSVRDIFWASGACLVIRRSAFSGNGGLDGDFFAHMEEIDLCWRLRARGRRIVCVPQSAVFHLGGGTLSTENPRKTYLNFRNNLLLLYKNLPEKKLRQTLAVRFFLDNLAAAKFLLTGDVQNAKAVWRARRDFRKIKNDFSAKRAENQRKATVATFAEMTQKSVVINFFARRKTLFSDYF